MEMLSVLLNYFKNNFKKESFIWYDNKQELKNRLKRLDSNYNLSIHLDTSYPYEEFLDAGGKDFLFAFLFYEKNVRCCCGDVIGTYNLFHNGIVRLENETEIIIYFYREGSQRFDRNNLYLSSLYKIRIHVNAILTWLHRTECLVSPVFIILKAFFVIFDRELLHQWKLFTDSAPTLKEICSHRISENKIILNEYRSFPFHVKIFLSIMHK